MPCSCSDKNPQRVLAGLSSHRRMGHRDGAAQEEPRGGLAPAWLGREQFLMASRKK